jgi:hypothetical protein
MQDRRGFCAYAEKYALLRSTSRDNLRIILAGLVRSSYAELFEVQVRSYR